MTLLERHRQRGYSFTEVLVAVSLIGLSTMIAIPNMQAGLRAVRLDSSSRQILRFLRVARMAAMASQDQYEVMLDPTQRVTIRNISDGTIEPGHDSVPLPQVKSVTLAAPGPGIIFNRDGTAPAAGTITIQGAGSSGTLSIEVYRSGLARIIK